MKEDRRTDKNKTKHKFQPEKIPAGRGKGMLCSKYLCWSGFHFPGKCRKARPKYKIRATFPCNIVGWAFFDPEILQSGFGWLLLFVLANFMDDAQNRRKRNLTHESPTRADFPVSALQGLPTKHPTKVSTEGPTSSGRSGFTCPVFTCSVVWRILGELPVNFSANFAGEFFPRISQPCSPWLQAPQKNHARNCRHSSPISHFWTPIFDTNF